MINLIDIQLKWIQTELNELSWNLVSKSLSISFEMMCQVVSVGSLVC